MASRSNNNLPPWLKHIATAIASGGVVAALIGLPKCTELQTVAAAEKFEAEVDSKFLENREEHRDFRETMAENRALIHKQVQSLLERLPKAD